MQTDNESNKEENDYKKARVIFPGSVNYYSNEFDKIVQYIQIEGVNRIPFGFLENQDKSTNNYIIYFHGNGENIGDSSYIVQGIMNGLKAHFILVEYPGYGVYQNTITTSEQIEKDALIVYDYIKQKFGVMDNQIYVFGRSIGTGPAFYLGVHRNFGGLIILSAYITLYKLVNDILPKQANLFLNEIHMNNEENSQKINCKCLFIHGKRDKLTFLQPIQDLYNNLPAHIKERSYLSIQEEMTHNFFEIQRDIVVPILKFYPEFMGTMMNQENEEYINQ